MKAITATNVLALLLLTSNAQAAPWTNEAGVALGGYDVVAYHTQHEAVRGSKSHSAKHAGATYYFVSTQNRAAFKKSPAKYLPAYDGYCAFAVAKNNAKVPSNPETFKIHNGTLLLFFNDYWEGTPFNTIVPWNQNEAAFYDKAQANWPKLAKKK